MTGPVNAPLGDLDEPTKLPETQVPEEALVEEKKLARYSQTAEYRRLKEFLEDRVKFYQTYLPNGDPVESKEPSVANWIAANVIIKELTNILSEYERAREVVKDSER